MRNGVLERNLTRNMVREPRRTDLMSWDPAWSPDGTRLAYSHSAQQETNIYAVDLTPGEVTSLTASPGVREEGAAYRHSGQVCASAIRDTASSMYASTRARVKYRGAIAGSCSGASYHLRVRCLQASISPAVRRPATSYARASARSRQTFSRQGTVR
ncbi:MAG: hypothetical protein GX649_05220 [Chloroflexi bacterium]|nr:hypothetical protein [Chloroflexota bacterium]